VPESIHTALFEFVSKALRVAAESNWLSLIGESQRKTSRLLHAMLDLVCLHPARCLIDRYIHVLHEVSFDVESSASRRL